MSSGLEMNDTTNVEWMHTLAEYIRKLPPSAPNQNRVKITMAWAIMSCGIWSNTPAAWVSCAPAQRMEVSRSAGTPSIDEDELES